MFERSSTSEGPSRTQLSLILLALNGLLTSWLVTKLGVDESTATEIANNVQTLIISAIGFFLVPRLKRQ